MMKLFNFNIFQKKRISQDVLRYYYVLLNVNAQFYFNV